MAAVDNSSEIEIGQRSLDRQCLVVMRHGLRQDEVQSDWASTSLQPWDPPLSAGGFEMVRLACMTLHNLGTLLNVIKYLG